MKRRRSAKKTSTEKPIIWLPIDSRLVHPLFRFGRVSGIARVFLQVEIILSVLVVIGTIGVAFLKLVLKQ